MATPATPPTLREIARRAGVSHTTVSLSLRNDPTIPERTRTRMHRLADAMGYRSNVLVSALMTQVRLRHRRSTPEVVGFLTGGPTVDDWKNHSSSVGFHDGARRRAAELGMRLENFWLGLDGARTAETCRMLRARAIRGNLVAPFPRPVYAKELDWSHLVCVALGYAFKSHSLHRATHHHFRGSFVAVENLTRLGYRRIGLLLDREENSRVDYSWLGGYLAARAECEGDALRPFFTDERDDPAGLRGWLRRERPEAVIGFGPKQLLALETAGCVVPRDLAFAALDVQQANLNAVNHVAGIDQNLPMSGATAIDILAGQLYHNEHGLPQRPVLSMIEGFWVDGKTAPGRTTGARPSRRARTLKN
ncbi:MAG: LacI family DNA-binding transcriptional regulator [Undibacterium sp.]|nr:LacI family DNA-binding transcriptional regulator [Opitutaceae bacterium]